MNRKSNKKQETNGKQNETKQNETMVTSNLQQQQQQCNELKNDNDYNNNEEEQEEEVDMIINDENNNNNEEIDMINDSKCMQKHIIETDELIQNSIQEFQQQLVQIQNDNVKKQHYLIACQYNPVWTSNIQFQLQFIRTEVFNVVAAVSRYLQYWTNRYILYKEQPLLAFTVTTQSNMSSIDYQTLQKGYIQTISGHSRVLYIDPANTIEKYDIYSIVRCVHYTVQKQIEVSNSAQKKGIIYIIDFNTIRTFDYKLMTLMSNLTNNSYPLRQTMTIILNAPPGTEYFVNVLKLFMQPKLRNRVHIISTRNVSKGDITLHNFTGIPSRSVLYTKLLNHTQWIQQQKLLEEKTNEQQQQQQNCGSTTPGIVDPLVGLSSSSMNNEQQSLTTATATTTTAENTTTTNKISSFNSGSSRSLESKTTSDGITALESADAFSISTSVSSSSLTSPTTTVVGIKVNQMLSKLKISKNIIMRKRNTNNKRNNISTNDTNKNKVHTSSFIPTNILSSSSPKVIVSSQTIGTGSIFRLTTI